MFVWQYSNKFLGSTCWVITKAELKQRLIKRGAELIRQYKLHGSKRALIFRLSNGRILTVYIKRG